MARALGKLGIHQVEYDETNGNLQGYSRGLEFAISPIAANRIKTTFHKIGHMVLGHTVGEQFQRYRDHRGQMEAEAEITAALCMHHLGLLDEQTAGQTRGYVQHWNGSEEFPEASARKILKTAGAIIQAGRESATTSITASTPTT